MSLLRCCVCTLFLLVSSVPAYAIEPFDSLKNGVNDIIARAEQAGNSLIKTLGEQMLTTITAMEASASQLIEEGKDAALVIEGELFNDIKTTIERLENDEQILMADLTSQTANWASLVSRLPFTDGRPEVMMVRPRVLAVSGPSEVLLKVVGPNISNASPSATFAGEPLQVNRQTDNEVVVKVSRDDFDFPDANPTFSTVQITFDASPPRRLLKPSTWIGKDIVEREITLMLLPRKVATFSIAPTVEVISSETKQFPTTTTARGKDSEVLYVVKLIPADKAAGWRFDTTKILASGVPHTRISDTGGSSCTGLVRESVSADSLVFRHQIGHRTGSFGKKSDGGVNCNTTLPLTRNVTKESSAAPIEGEISATEDVTPSLPSNLVSYQISIDLFSGQKFILKEGIAVPHGLLEVEHSTDSIHFRPKPPRDF